MCFSLCIHPERMARRQIQADNISKETLQYCILTSNYSNVYSNQRHNRWRMMNLWQAGRSRSSWSCGFWCLMTASQEELTHSSVSDIKTVLSAAEKRTESAAIDVLKSMLSYYCSLICKQQPLWFDLPRLLWQQACVFCLNLLNEHKLYVDIVIVTPLLWFPFQMPLVCTLLPFELHLLSC